LVTIASIAVILLTCGVDFVNYARARLRMDQVSNSMANVVSGYQQLYDGDFPTFGQLSQQTAGTIDVSSSNGATIFTGITNPKGKPTVAWRKQIGNASFTSDLGPVGGAPTNLPDGYVPPVDGSVIAVEIYSSIHPWVLSVTYMGGIGPPTLRSVALFRPRSTTLSTISPGNRP